MNSLYINFSLNTCFKLNVNTKVKFLLSNIPKEHVINQKCGFRSSSCSYFRTTEAPQVLKDGITGLPSPQEVSSLLFFKLKCRNQAYESNSTDLVMFFLFPSPITCLIFIPEITFKNIEDQ